MNTMNISEFKWIVEESGVNFQNVTSTSNNSHKKYLPHEFHSYKYGFQPIVASLSY